MKTPQGWQSWDQQLQNLVATGAPRALAAIEDLDIQTQLTLLGEFEVYFGYRRQGIIRYSQSPLSFSLVAAKPDIRISRFTLDPKAKSTGSPLNLKATVSNSGNTVTAATILHYYQSSDAGINSSDSEICTDNIAALAIAENSKQSCQTSMPTTPGTYFYGVCVDNIANETDTGNNCSTGEAVAVSPDQGLDLVILSFESVRQTVTAGSELILSVNVANEGNALAPDSELVYYQRATNANHDTTLQTGDRQICRNNLYRLPAGHSSGEVCRVSAPNAAGDYYYGVCIKTVAGENNLANNCSGVIKVTVVEPPPVVESTPVTLTCTASQVLENGVCVTPEPTCSAPQVLENGVCVTPTPTCTAPQVLENGVCVTPTPTCTLPQVLQNNVCITPNVAPTANAGTAQNVVAQSLVTLDGSKSQDTDGSIVSFLWKQISGPSVTLNNPTMITPTFTAPTVTQTTDLKFKLTVTDNQGATGNAVVIISVAPFIQKTTISGVAFDAPIIGGTVTIKSLSGTPLGTAITDDNGKYSLELSETAISAGYRVDIAGGQMDGKPFTGRMTAVYASTETRTNANLTPITTLIQGIAQDSTGADALAKRNDALQTLVRLGLIPSTDWNQLDSTWFDLFGLSGRIRDAGGIGAWIQLIKDDLADGELSVEEAKSLFPKAHGGIERVSVASDDNIALFSGEQRLVSITTEPAIDSNSLILKLLDAPSWVWVEGDHLHIEPPLATAVGDSNVTVEIATNALTTGRKLNFTVSVLQQVTLLSGTLGPAGGRLENQWKDIILEVPAGALTQTYDLQYVAGTSSGGMQFKLKSTPVISKADSLKFVISQPSPQIIATNYLQSLNLNRNTIQKSVQIPKTVTTTSSETDFTPCEDQPYTDADGDGFIFDRLLSSHDGYFISSMTNFLQFRIVPNQEMIISDKTPGCTSILRYSGTDGMDNKGNIEPVLFVHGFALGDIGEIDNYFKYFPGLVAKWKPNGKNYKPFTFVWHTNSRFEDIAFELGNAIKKINKVTGKQVHIVAHSYGGLLVRTLLQGLAEKKSTDNHNNPIMVTDRDASLLLRDRIASVTTVGTPHSGIFASQQVISDKNGNSPITFYEGRDTGLNNHFLPTMGDTIQLCTAITCYEAGGDDLIITNRFVNYKFLYGVWNKPGQIAYSLAHSFTDSYPKIPTQILIGINPRAERCVLNASGTTCNMQYRWDKDEEGDNLISLAGQRLYPGYHNSVPPELLARDDDDKIISEHLLGLNAEQPFMGDRKIEDIYDETADWTGYDDFNSYYIGGDFSDEFPLRSVGYDHMGGSYDYYHRASISHVNRWTPRLSEVALDNCAGADPNSCQHATWTYFTRMVTKYPAKLSPEGQIIKAKGRVKNSTQNSSVNSLILKSLRPKAAVTTPKVLIYAGNTKLEETYADAEGNFEADVDFLPDTQYSVEVIQPGAGNRGTRRERSTVSTLEESGTLDFGEIDLFAMIFEQSNIPVQLKDGSTGAELFGYQLTLKNENGAVLLTKTVNSAADALINDLPFGVYMVEIIKTGYIGTGKQECIAGLLGISDTCTVTMVPQAYVLTGGLSAVLTWGQDPNDLDSHLLQYNATDNLLCHVYYGSQVCGNDSLDVDDTSSFGPETIKITALDAAKHYVYAIHHYSGSGSITSTSQAQVKVTFADGSTRTFTAPTSGGNGDDDYWRVFDIVDNKLLPCQQNCMQTAIAPRTRSFDSATDTLPWKEDIAKDLRPK